MSLGRVTKTGEGKIEAENWTMGGSVSSKPPQTAFSRAGTAGRMPSWLAPEGQWNAGQSEHWEKKSRKQGRSHLSCDPVLSQGLEREDVLCFLKRCFDCTVGNESKQRPTAIREAMRRLSPQSGKLWGDDYCHNQLAERPCPFRWRSRAHQRLYRGLDLTFVLLECSHSWLHSERWGLCLCFPSEDVGAERFNGHAELHSPDMQTQHRNTEWVCP